MNFTQYIRLLILLLLLPNAVFSADQLTGKIIDHKTKQPLIGAAVFWEGTTRGTSTDVNGQFQLAWPDSFPSTLLVRYTGYKGKGLIFSGKNPLNVQVELDATAGDTIVIYDRRAASEFSFLSTIMVEGITQNGLRKAACCNLSESFETNPTVDAAVTDAVSGAKKIQLLGLDGVYSQILFENLPLIRGLSSSYGLSYVPGTWIKGILVTKGTGSVVNGYESIAGQLNIDLLMPDDEDADKFFANVYLNHLGRYEANLHFNRMLNERVGTTLLTHASTQRQRNDMDRDGFLDMPLYTQYNALNRWEWHAKKYAQGEFGARFVYDDRQGGQFMYDRSRDFGTTNFYGVGIKNQQAEFFNKTGFVFNGPSRSLGTMFSARWHNEDMYFGLKKYAAEQRSLYANVIWQDMIGNTNHLYKVGTSFVYDEYHEKFNDSTFNRTEIIPGIFAEYTGHLTDRFTLVAGIRADAHNTAGFQVTPRLHLKYDVTPKTAVRLSGGKGFRTTNIFTENSAVFASSRQMIIEEALKAEMAWNYGGSIQQLFTFLKNDATFIVDFFRTDFTNQIVIDQETPGELKFYNLRGKSFANSFQADLSIQPVKRFDVRIAYKFYDVQTTYNDTLKQRPLTARHRAFLNLAYALPYDKWTFDLTTKWIGSTRLPATALGPERHSEPFYILSANVSRKFRKGFTVYAGGENLLNFRQKNPILGANDPFGPYFDATQVYAPTDGLVLYAGLRFKI